MKVLTSAEMREVDRLTVELGVPEPVLMENAASRVVELLEERFSPLSDHRIVVFCGKGNNGGDGLAIARQLWTRYSPRSLDVVRAEPAEEITLPMRQATIVVDALLGTGIRGGARGRTLELIHEINTGFPFAKVVAVDIPSGMSSDSGRSEGEFARADYTVTFTALKVAHAMAPNCDSMGEVRLGPIGSPENLYETVSLHVSEPADFRDLLKPRPKESNKGSYGHAIVVGGAEGKYGAAEMAGLAALRAGAGLVTVASSAPALRTLELMTEALPETVEALEKTAARKTVLAIGPGLGDDPKMVALVRWSVRESPQPMVVDADGLNALVGSDWRAGGRLRVITPHPGEMARLCGVTVADVQADRLGLARATADKRGVVVVLKGNRTIVAFPDGRAWINPTGSPGMATGGTGDILTGLIAGLLAQFPHQQEPAILAAVYLHGLCGELAAAALGEMCLIATDLLTYLPEAMRVCRQVPH
jgi:ADP-dependent NAD(P)H-hydrate dehydratase / NAD(P)H-hydrate epimerase